MQRGDPRHLVARGRPRRVRGAPSTPTRSTERTTFEVAANVLTGLRLGAETEALPPALREAHRRHHGAGPLRFPLGRLDRALRARAELARLLRPRVQAARAAAPRGLLGQLAHHRDADGRCASRSTASSGTCSSSSGPATTRRRAPRRGSSTSSRSGSTGRSAFAPSSDAVLGARPGGAGRDAGPLADELVPPGDRAHVPERALLPAHRGGGLRASAATSCHAERRSSIRRTSVIAIRRRWSAPTCSTRTGGAPRPRAPRRRGQARRLRRRTARVPRQAVRQAAAEAHAPRDPVALPHRARSHVAPARSGRSRSTTPRSRASSSRPCPPAPRQRTSLHAHPHL